MGPFLSDLCSLGEEVSEEIKEAICDLAEGAIRAGVTITMSEWIKMHPIERAAFREASDRVWLERASFIGDASRSSIVSAYMRSEEDGHNMRAREAVNLMARKNLALQEKGEAPRESLAGDSSSGLSTRCQDMDW